MVKSSAAATAPCHARESQDRTVECSRGVPCAHGQRLLRTLESWAAGPCMAQTGADEATWRERSGSWAGEKADAAARSAARAMVRSIVTGCQQARKRAKPESVYHLAGSVPPSSSGGEAGQPRPVRHQLAVLPALRARTPPRAAHGPGLTKFDCGHGPLGLYVGETCGGPRRGYILLHKISVLLEAVTSSHPRFWFSKLS